MFIKFNNSESMQRVDFLVHVHAKLSSSMIYANRLWEDKVHF